MSGAASWSYTAKITIWRLGAYNDWTGVRAFEPPVVFMGDYSAKAERLVSRAGNEFVSQQTIFTEYALAKEGDFVKIGEYTELDPFAVGAQEVLLVLDYGDTLERLMPDYKLVT